MDVPELRFGQRESFWERAVPDSKTGCWEWVGGRVPKGYGTWSMYGPNLERYPNMAHRWAWVLTHGAIPEGLEIDHLCRNRGCVNPEHMELVTHAENQRRGIWPRETHANARKTHCRQGHEFTPANTYIHTDRVGNVRRHCRACQRARAARWRVSVS